MYSLAAQNHLLKVRNEEILFLEQLHSWEVKPYHKKNAVCEESSATAYDVFDCEFDFDSDVGVFPN